MSKTTTPTSFFFLLHNFSYLQLSSAVPEKNVNNRRELSLKRTRSRCVQNEAAWIGNGKKHWMFNGRMFARIFHTESLLWKRANTPKLDAAEKTVRNNWNNDDFGHREILLQTHPGNDTKRTQKKTHSNGRSVKNVKSVAGTTFGVRKNWTKRNCQECN